MRNLWVIIFLSSMCLLFSGISGYMFFHVQTLVSEGGTVSGTVVHLEPSAKGAYCPVVEFRTADGQVFREKSNTGQSPPAYKTGDTVEVIYNKANPKDWFIHSFWDMYFLPIMLGVAGLGLFIAASIVTFKSLTGGGPSPGRFRSNRL